MLEIEYSSYFVRKFKKLQKRERDEVLNKIEMFKDEKNHHQLKVHKLSGKLAEQWSFSLSHKSRIIFYFGKNNKIAYLLDLGDHSIYE